MHRLSRNGNDWRLKGELSRKGLTQRKLRPKTKLLKVLNFGGTLIYEQYSIRVCVLQTKTKPTKLPESRGQQPLETNDVKKEALSVYYAIPQNVGIMTCQATSL